MRGACAAPRRVLGCRARGARGDDGLAPTLMTAAVRLNTRGHYSGRPHPTLGFSMLGSGGWTVRSVPAWPQSGLRDQEVPRWFPRTGDSGNVYCLSFAVARSMLTRILLGIKNVWINFRRIKGPLCLHSRLRKINKILTHSAMGFYVLCLGAFLSDLRSCEKRRE